MSQPNILFVMADQLSALALPMYGHPVVKTPALSALADRGLVFENAYCNFPLCGPSRQSMMCGKLPSRCGTYDNATMLASDQPTFAHYLASAGYKTCLSGKMHFVGPNQMHGFGERLTTDVYPADFGWTPDWTADPSTATFQDTRNVFETGPCARSMQLDYDEDTAYQAERWLFDQARKDGPWMLTVSFTHPHDPYQATPEFWDLYDDSDIDLPALGFEDVETDAHSARIRSHYSIDQAKVDDNTLRRMRHGYYAAISYIDAKVARLVQVLEQSGMDKNTIIIFTSDHGDMMGERGLFYKKSFWEWSARVPMIVAGPGIKPGRKSQPVSLIDLLPTFCEIADVQPLDADGQSLLSDSLAPVFSELLCEGINAPTFMIRDGNLKLHWAKDDPPLLFDLRQDPQERQNVADDPAYQSDFARLVALAKDTWDVETLTQDILESQSRRQFLKNLPDPDWDHAPDLSMKHRYVRAGKWTTEVEGAAFLAPPPKP